MYKSQGAALITALLILAISAALATVILVGQRELIHQATLANGADRLTQSLQSVMVWADKTIKSRVDITKVKQFKQTIDGVSVDGMIYGLGGRFNMNTLQQTTNIPRFVALLRAAVPGMTSSRATRLAQNVSQFMQATTQNKKYYLNHDPAYRPAGHAIVDLSELRLVQGFDAKLYRQLVLGPQPYLTALPISTYHLNVNEASVPTWMTMEAVNESQAKQLVECARQSPSFTQLNAFVTHCATGMAINPKLATVVDSYYLVKAWASVNGQRAQMQSLVKVSLGNKQIKLTTVWQEYSGE